MLRGVLLFACAAAAGVLSAWGVGGGTALLLWLTMVMGVELPTAGAVNLLFFLPTALAGLWFHRKRGLISGEVWRRGVVPGLLGALAGTAAASVLPPQILRRPLGLLLLWGGWSLLRRGREFDNS